MLSINSQENAKTGAAKIRPSAFWCLCLLLGSTGLARAGLNFEAIADLATGAEPGGIVASDLNGDGHPDLSTANRKDGTLSILLANGDGTFQSKVDYPAGLYPSSVTAADLNDDGYPDLAATDLFYGNVSVLLGKGDGTFQAKTDYPAIATPVSVVAADLNGDGHPDLATVSSVTFYGTPVSTVAVLLGNGDGTFQAAAYYPASASGLSAAIIAADLNGDSHPDLATANAGDNTVSVLLGQGDGGFQAKTAYPAGNMYASVASVVAADLNGDGHPDLATANAGDNTVSVLLGKGDGGFQAAVDYPTGQSPASIVATDFNGDGHADLATANRGDNTLSVLLGNGTGGFYSGMGFGLGHAPSGLAASDINGDGRPDLLAPSLASNTVSVLLNQSTPGPLISVGKPVAFADQTLDTTSAPQSVTLANTGAAPLVLRSGSFKLPPPFSTSGDFAVADNCPDSLAPGASCTLTLTFTPTDIGPRTGNLNVPGENGAAFQTIALSGVGIAPVYPIAADLSLKLTAPKKAKAGKRLAYTFTVKNKSGTKVPNAWIKGVLADGAAYARLPPSCTATGQSLDCQVGALGGKKQKALAIKVRPGAAGVLSFKAKLAGQASDPNQANNTAAVVTVVK